MTILRHWHPVCLESELKTQPIQVQVGDDTLVVFRTVSGKIGALDNVCPHRRMSLSCGAVVGERITCPYHGWSFGCDGFGESPGTPKLTTHTSYYRARSFQGCVWVQSNDSNLPFPSLSETEGFTFIRPLIHLIDAPLELVLDNFTEAEHVGTVHRFFGYAPERLFEVQNTVTADDDTVSVVNEGPQRPLPFLLRWTYGIAKDARFHWEWTTRFSPVHVAYHEYWSDAQTGQEQGVRARIFLFLTPIGRDRTRVTTLASFRLPYSPLVNRLCLIFRDLARWTIDYEIRKDARMIGRLADKRIDVAGMKLSRFDKPLTLHREKIERLYRHEDTKQRDLKTH